MVEFVMIERNHKMAKSTRFLLQLFSNKERMLDLLWMKINIKKDWEMKRKMSYISKLMGKQ